MIIYTEFRKNDGTLVKGSVHSGGKKKKRKKVQKSAYCSPAYGIKANGEKYIITGDKKKEVKKLSS